MNRSKKFNNKELLKNIKLKCSSNNKIKFMSNRFPNLDLLLILSCNHSLNKHSVRVKFSKKVIQKLRVYGHHALTLDWLKWMMMKRSTIDKPCQNTNRYNLNLKIHELNLTMQGL